MGMSIRARQPARAQRCGAVPDRAAFGARIAQDGRPRGIASPDRALAPAAFGLFPAGRRAGHAALRWHRAVGRVSG
jgi:hypothetical protein